MIRRSTPFPWRPGGRLEIRDPGLPDQLWTVTVPRRLRARAAAVFLAPVGCRSIVPATSGWVTSLLTVRPGFLDERLVAWVMAGPLVTSTRRASCGLSVRSEPRSVTLSELVPVSRDRPAPLVARPPPAARARFRVAGCTESGPAKRVLDAWPGYVKTIDGVDAVLDAGLDQVIARCGTLRD
jgi:hypothetical protein